MDGVRVGLQMTKVEGYWRMAESGRAGQAMEATGLDVLAVGGAVLLGWWADGWQVCWQSGQMQVIRYSGCPEGERHLLHSPTDRIHQGKLETQGSSHNENIIISNVHYDSVTWHILFSVPSVCLLKRCSVIYQTVALYIAASNNGCSLGHETDSFWAARGKNEYVTFCLFLIKSCFYCLLFSGSFLSSLLLSVFKHVSGILSDHLHHRQLFCEFPTSTSTRNAEKAAQLNIETLISSRSGSG